MDDEVILDLYFARDEQAIRQTEVKYGTFCMSIAQGILASAQDAEECVNDMYLKAWNSIPPQRPQRLRMWLGKVVRNLALDRYRRNHAKRRDRALELSLEELEECIPLPDGDADHLPELLNRFLAGLEMRDQQLFVGRYWYHYTLEQLSDGHSIPVSTVKYRIDKVRDQLKVFLGKEGYRV